MIGQTTSPIQKLYDQDYQVWLETTLEQWREGTGNRRQIQEF